ncbi:MAG: tRNA epoxyqueuosine(34) reductase QueG [Candidatus Koribacter versatilis]|uniref:tRNA epoxyqueuosine(34) reductase QueG n=1 Tax=Candidatus Korobacter versatilis TaxID=658062 RepID=A0A932A9N6_9BACT|nr:tRNA epoxyqueuosine(34) reductase QueG [Candidatus Koribacter versatilis]
MLDLTAAARDAGFDRCGVASLAQPMPELDFFPGWLDSGAAGDMHYLASRDDQGRLKRASIQQTFPWAKSAVVCALDYNTPQPYSTECTDSQRGWISRYAWFPNTDYHQAVMSRLERLESAIIAAHPPAVHANVQTRRYVDTGPLLERVLAKYAGLGWLAKNTCVISEELGSWIFLGVILASLDLSSATPAPPAADRCGACTACLDACPTHAFPAPYQLDASRCISYLTIEKRGDIPEDLRAGIGNNVFGCDICQDVCPWNSTEVRHKKSRTQTRAPEFVPARELVNPPLAWLAEMSREDFQKHFRHSPIKRAKYSGLRRNAVVAIGNSNDRTFLPLLERLTQDDDPVVARHAKWSLESMSK